MFGTMNSKLPYFSCYAYTKVNLPTGTADDGSEGTKQITVSSLARGSIG